ncbi:hypothetical protein RND20_018910, partial [Providencia rettgeri]|nr:hypothetical protein [Providencia rettgeri]
ERSQRTYRLKNDEKIILSHSNFFFPLNNSSEKKAVSENIPRSTHKYVTWGAERSQRTYRLKNDEKIILSHSNFFFPLNNSSEKKAVTRISQGAYTSMWLGEPSAANALIAWRMTRK